MFGDIYPMRYMGKQLICLGGWNFGYQNFAILGQSYAADKASNIEFLMLVSEL